MRRRPGVAGTARSAQLPAPMGGLNTVAPAAAMAPTEALQLFNLTPSEYGLRSRLGSREWVTGLSGFLDNQVRTVMPFTGAAANGASDRLFVTTSTGIWNASASTAAPALPGTPATPTIAFGINTGQAGHGISHVAVTAGGHFLLYCDEENGLFIYSEATDTWVKPVAGVAPGEINGANPDNFVFCTVWKHRVFYVEKDTSRAWYTGLGAITGTVTAFDFAQRFRAGGPLVGLWNWTYDGGAGVDDSLVAVSGGGDVAIYQGTSIATDIALKGVWTLGGSPPAGRRIATDWGGELLLLSRVGVLPISQLVSGTGEAQYTTAKIANLFNTFMLTRASLLGWSLRIHPEDNCLMVTVPVVAGAPTEQLVMSLAGRGWSRYRDLPIISSEVWGGKLYVGTHDGRVLVNDGYVDGVLLADVNAFIPVQWAVLTSFQSLGDGRYKRVELVRPSFLAGGVVSSYSLAARYRYNFAELPPVAGTGTTPGGGGTWDDSVWDSDVWAGEYTPTQALNGATGIGVEMAVAMRGQAVSRTILLGWDVLYSSGGWL